VSVTTAEGAALLRLARQRVAAAGDSTTWRRRVPDGGVSGLLAAARLLLEETTVGEGVGAIRVESRVSVRVG
jgi:hypothetical protein